MPDQTIICPHCHQTIPLSDALLQHTADLEAQITTKLQAEQATQFEQKLTIEKKKLWAIAQQKATEKQHQQLADLENQVKESQVKLKQAEQQELELRKKSRELEDRQQKIELELARKLDEERQKIADTVRKTEAESQQLKLQEKDKQMEILKKTIDDLRRQSEQGSMQIQGEVQEDGLKKLLETAFPMDSIGDVATGTRGADVLQVINGKLAKGSGSILWESKNTKAYSKAWLSKLKHDQGIVQADVAILVSQVLPDGVTNFVQKNGIWIVSYELAVPLATALRFHIAELGKARASLDGREEKAEVLLQYFSSSQFRNRIENLVMAFVEMKADLETEKRSFQRIWSKREKELEAVIGSTASLYGDLQGIIGRALPSIPQLGLPLADDEIVPELE